MEQAKKAYEAYVLALEGKAPAGLAVPPYDLQSWEQLPASVRAAWEAATAVVAPEPVDLTEPEPEEPPAEPPSGAVN